MNELSVIGSLCLPKFFWDRHKDKHCNSLEKNVRPKVVSMSKETISVRDHRFFALFFQKRVWVILIRR